MSTYTPISSFTATTSVSSVTISGIPQNYTDLVLVASITGVSAATDPWIRVGNGSVDTGSNYSWTWLAGNGGTAQSARASNNSKLYYSAISTIQNAVQQVTWNFNNYSNTTTYKTVLWRESDASTETAATVGLWRSTAAINTIEISLDASRTYSAGTTFNLYGIDAQASAQAKATGGQTIIRDSNYWYHVFTSSGTFVPTENITADYLVVGGGGAGGHGGGGGAGGLRAITSQSLTADTNYTCTVGAGGSSYLYNPSSNGTSGNDSTFNSFTSTGGGRAATGSYAAATGGSGGGGASTAFGLGYINGAAGNTPSTSPSQGNSGGNGGSGSNFCGGGGGGAGGAGASSSGATAGAGGAGANSYNSITFTSWLSATTTGVSGYLAGGGGGGGDTANSGGSGGGGAGATGDNNATAGAMSTGSGGGGVRISTGSANTALSGAGGSGIVIIRYAV